MATEAVEASPVYRSTARELADRIRRGDLPAGSRVPSERELAVEYGISRMTARAAVNLLGQRGLVERRGRSGTFVSSPRIELDLSSVAGLSARLLRQGITPGARIVEAREMGAGELDGAVAGGLGVAGDESVYVVVRTRTGDGEPLALEESYFPVRRCPGLLDHELTGSIYELLRDRYGLEPGHLRQEVELTQLDSAAAAKLGTRPDVPVLQVTRTAWDVDGRPIEFARDLYRGDRLLFIAETDQVTGKRKGTRKDRER